MPFDYFTVSTIIGIVKNVLLPKVSSGDAGSMMVVDSEGKWAAGLPTTASISVSNHTLTIIPAEDND